MFRRGRRHVAPPELSQKGVEDQPYWLAVQGGTPEPPQPALSLTRLGDRRPTSAPLQGVSTDELLAALSGPYSPAELDWELVGVAFTHWNESDPEAHRIESPDAPLPQAPEAPLDASASVRSPERKSGSWVGPAVASLVPAVASLRQAIADAKRKRWLAQRERIMGAVQQLSWDGYRSLVADIFKREGYEVLAAEGDDADVIDMEVMRGRERVVVSCQLRGLSSIDAAPLQEMTDVAARYGAAGAIVVADGTFDSEARSFAAENSVVLIDGDKLLDLVLDLTVGDRLHQNLGAKLARLWPGTISRAQEQKAS